MDCNPKFVQKDYFTLVIEFYSLIHSVSMRIIIIPSLSRLKDVKKLEQERPEQIALLVWSMVVMLCVIHRIMKDIDTRACKFI